MSSFLPWMAPYSGWMVMALMALCGLLLAWRGPRPRAGDGSPRCPSCEYNLTGLPKHSHNCPECGLATSGVHRTGRPIRWPWWIAGAFVALALPALVIQYRVRYNGWEYYLRLYPLYAVFPDVVTKARDVGGYRAEVIEDRRRFYNGGSYDERRLTLRRGSTTYFEFEDWYWSLVSSDVSFPPPDDVNGNGIADLVVEGNTGGAHCCGTLFIFELAPDQPKLIAQIDTAHGYDGFVDLNGDGVHEIVKRDWSFAYWNTSFAGSPAPKVILSWDGERYRPDASLMHAPPPPPAELAALAGEYTATPGRDAMGIPLHVILDLIYTGHSDLAYNLFDQSWPDSVPGKAQFRRELLLQLASSPHRELIETLGHPRLPRESEPRD